MEPKSVWTSVALAGVLLAWLFLDLKYERQIDYNWYPYLIEPSTGGRIKPSDLLAAEKVLTMPDGYVNATNSFERLHDLEFMVNLGTGLEIDQEYSNEHDLVVSGWPVANRTKCAQQLGWVRQQLSGEQHHSLIRGQLGHELTQLMDSFGRPEPGLYSGATAWPGAYQRCLSTRLNSSQFGSRYCWLRLRPKWWPRNDPVRPQARIRMGVCLPETCDTLAFADQRPNIEWLATLDLNEFQRQNLEADSMFCPPDERSPIRRLPLAARIYLALVLAWILLVLTCSIAYETTLWTSRKRGAAQISPPKLGQTIKLELKHHSDAATSAPPPAKTRLLPLLKAISIQNSIESFRSGPVATLTSNSPHLKSRLDLSCLNALKFMMAIMVVLGHSFYMTVRFTRINRAKILLGTQTTGLVVMSIGRFVDTFFLLFGLLAAYTLLRKVQPDKLATPTVWLAYNLNVLVRLMPLIVPLYFYSQLVSVYVSHGPWWDYGLYDWTLKGHCRNEPWWKVIPLLGYVGRLAGVPCLPVDWFLVVYSQLSLIIPVLVCCLYKLPNQLARGALIVYSVAVSSVFLVIKMSGQTTFPDGSFGLFGALLVDLMEKFESLGAMSSLGRAGCIAIGCYVGYLLRMYEVGSIRKWPRWFTSRLTLGLVFVLNALLFLLPFIGNEISQLMQHQTSLNEFIAGFLVTGILWSVLNSLLIVMLVTTYNRTSLIRFFGHSSWHSANKLGFGIFLVHWEVLYTMTLGYEQGPSLGFEADCWKLFAYGLLASSLLAFVLHIFIEAPASALLNLLLQGAVNRRPLEMHSKSDGDKMAAAARLNQPEA